MRATSDSKVSVLIRDLPDPLETHEELPVMHAQIIEINTHIVAAHTGVRRNRGVRALMEHGDTQEATRGVRVGAVLLREGVGDPVTQAARRAYGWRFEEHSTLRVAMEDVSLQ